MSSPIVQSMRRLRLPTALMVMCVAFMCISTIYGGSVSALQVRRLRGGTGTGMGKSEKGANERETEKEDMSVETRPASPYSSDESQAQPDVSSPSSSSSSAATSESADSSDDEDEYYSALEPSDSESENENDVARSDGHESDSSCTAAFDSLCRDGALTEREQSAEAAESEPTSKKLRGSIQDGVVEATQPLQCVVCMEDTVECYPCEQGSSTDDDAPRHPVCKDCRRKRLADGIASSCPCCRGAPVHNGPHPDIGTLHNKLATPEVDPFLSRHRHRYAGADKNFIFCESKVSIWGLLGDSGQTPKVFIWGLLGDSDTLDVTDAEALRSHRAYQAAYAYVMDLIERWEVDYEDETRLTRCIVKYTNEQLVDWVMNAYDVLLNGPEGAKTRNEDAQEENHEELRNAQLEDEMSESESEDDWDLPEEGDGNTNADESGTASAVESSTSSGANRSLSTREMRKVEFAKQQAEKRRAARLYIREFPDDELTFPLSARAAKAVDHRLAHIDEQKYIKQWNYQTNNFYNGQGMSFREKSIDTGAAANAEDKLYEEMTDLTVRLLETPWGAASGKLEYHMKDLQRVRDDVHSKRRLRALVSTASHDMGTRHDLQMMREYTQDPRWRQMLDDTRVRMHAERVEDTITDSQAEAPCTCPECMRGRREAVRSRLHAESARNIFDSDSVGLGRRRTASA